MKKGKRKISFQFEILYENHYYKFQSIGLPQISFICCIFDMITNRFEHSTSCGYQTTIEYLKMIDFDLH